MERPPDQHLSLYELTLLASENAPSQADRQSLEEKRRLLEQHILSCTECQQLLFENQFLLRLSMRLPMKDHLPHAGPSCPTDQQWMEYVAGLHSPAKTQEYLDHAVLCPLCCARLKRFAEHFADDTTEEEARLLSSLNSADPGWRQEIARRMQAPGAQDKRFDSPETAWYRGLLSRLGAALAAAVVLVTALWAINYTRPNRVVSRQLSEAYSQQRTIDMRMVGADYSAVAVLRGGELSETTRPLPLLEAQVTIARELASKPDDPFWLDAQGRMDLMNDNYSSALSSLERAASYAPGNESIHIDLATSYFLRGDILKRPEDYGRAVELLGQVLSKNPKNRVARFNRAIAFEHLFLYDRAVGDWQLYLEFDPQSEWASEARRRLSGVQEKINQQKQKSEQPVLGPAQFVALLEQNKEAPSRQLDGRIERYLEPALCEWLPQAFLGNSDSRDIARKALDNLAELLISRHQDHWLADFLRELRARPQSLSALPDLIDSIQTSRTSDLDRARAAAEKAKLYFHRTGNQPGELLSDFESSYADQLAHQVTNCLSEARARNDPVVAQRYPWILIQFSLESAVCTDMNDEAARRLTSDALTLARSHHYPALELRATTFLAALYEYMGDISSAWKYSADGLARFWGGDFAAMRGYGVYSVLDSVAEDTEQWFLDAELLRQAYRFVAADPDLELRAMARHRLANALAMTGDLVGAEASLREAQALFLHSADGTRKQNLECEAAIGLAKLELLGSHPQKAIQILAPLEAQARILSDKDLVFDYFRNLGLAYFALGNASEANNHLSQALLLAEQSLSKNHDERERLIWSRKTDQVYRAMVELKSTGSEHDAFTRWQWFKGASLSDAVGRNSQRKKLPFQVPSDAIVVSFAFLPGNTVAWTYSADQVKQFHVAISAAEAGRLAHRFADHCSRPDSNPASLRAEAQILYQTLFGSMEPLLISHRHLIIEPDEALWMIPFGALVDGSGVYLEDRYAISLSPGLDYLAASPEWVRISSTTPILLAGNPRTSGRRSLEDAEAEVKGISRQFRYSKLLLGDEASSEKIAEGLRNVDVFHFSGHAIASPGGVGLILGDSVVMDVAKIQASDFAKLKLAVLSACDSAKGSANVFDDRDSLARSLIGVGVPDVVASRWMVDSQATAVVMKDFYTQLLSGKSVSEALGFASRSLRKNSEFSHPFYWAGFSAFGKS